MTRKLLRVAYSERSESVASEFPLKVIHPRIVRKYIFFCIVLSGHGSFNQISGDAGYVVPPVPIPNTVVKHSYAESTCLETDWEDRELPVKRDVRWGVFFICYFLMIYCRVFSVHVE